jgi:hypothetical protein
VSGVFQCQAHGDRADADEGAFHRAGDGARVGDVLGEIGAVVDAGQNEIGGLVLQHMTHAHDNAIGGRSAHGKGALSDFAITQRHLKGERVRGA